MRLNSIRVFIFGLFALLPCAAFGASKAAIEPAAPKWGDRARLIYNLTAAEAKIHKDDTVVANLAVWYPESVEEHSVPVSRSGDQLIAEWTVPDSASYVAVTFVTKELTDGSISSMIWTRDGREARGAWRQSMLTPYLQKDYVERTARELALYPDYWDVYRDKWFVATAYDRAGLKEALAAELPRLERDSVGRPVGALYSLSYGYLLKGNEPAGRATIREMVERFPDSPRTIDAIHSYEYQAYSQHFTGDGSKEVRQWLLGYYKRNPSLLETRNGLDSIGQGNPLPLETLETICRKWIRDEPNNPKPYIQLAAAYKGDQLRVNEALSLIEKALDLINTGESRLHGDTYGFLDKRLQVFYMSAAELALAAKQYSKALAYAKVAQTGGKETLPAGFAVEAQVWEQLNRPVNQQVALREAWRRGDGEAYAKLALVYRTAHGSPDGFEKFLSGSDALSKPGGERKAAPSFRGVGLDGQPIDSNQLKGKIIVANFWFTGCGPCKAEIPELNKLVAQFKGKDVVFLAFTLDENVADLKSFLKGYPFQYVIVPKSSKTAVDFKVEAYPTHAIIAADGKLESLLVGAGDHRADELRTVISRLLANGSGKN